MLKRKLFAGLAALCLALSLTACDLSGLLPDGIPESPPATRTESESAAGGGGFALDAIPPYSGEAYVPLNDNIPDFDPDDLPARSFEEAGGILSY